MRYEPAMSRFKEVPFLVFAATLLALYALLDRYLRSPMGPFLIVAVGMAFAYSRRGRGLQVPRPVLVSLVVFLVAALNISVFVLKVHPEGALVAFLVILIVAKSLILRKLNDYSQLMFLSVLTMMAAGSYNPTRLFLPLMILYTLVAGYAVFRFHLLSEMVAHRQMQKTAPTLVVDTGSRSWVRPFLSAAMATCLAAGIIFVFIPREGPSLLFHNEYGSPQGSLTGFSQELALGQMTQTLQDPTAVLRVKYLRDEAHKTFSRVLYLRGAVLSQYVQFGNLWKWLEDRSGTGDVRSITFTTQGKSIPIQPATRKPEGQHLWRISYEGPISTNLFVIDRPVAVAVNRPVSLSYDPQTNTLFSGSQAPDNGFSYELLTEPEPDRTPPATRPAVAAAPKGDRDAAAAHRVHGPRRRHRRAHAGIRDAARSPGGPVVLAEPPTTKPVDVASFAPLARSILKDLPPGAGVEDKASRIESWLKANFTYTLDNRDVSRAAEPVMDFLVRRKHGHCEYFASAMAMLARSVGIDARVVVGFKGGEYNSFGDYYRVRNLDAHAWVEVFSPRQGWTRFDPTPPGREDFIREQEDKRFKWFWDLVDLVQYSWADRVANFDNKDRKSFMKSLQERMPDTELNLDDGRISLRKLWGKLVDFIKGKDYESVWLQLLHTCVALLVLVLVVIFGRILIDVAGIVASDVRRVVQRRWEERYGRLWFCPVEFYRRLLLWLSGRGVTRTSSETAREFAVRFGRAFPRANRPFRVVTEAYLAIRFGRRKLSPKGRAAVTEAAEHVQQTLAEPEKRKTR